MVGVMKGVASNTLILVGHATLVLTSGYILTLLYNKDLITTGNGAVVTYGGFLLLGIAGLFRYIRPTSTAQRVYRELSSVTHAVGLFSLALTCLQIHQIHVIPDTSYPAHLILLASFLASRFLFGAYVEDILTKIFWSSSAILIFYTGLRAHHWMELIGSTFLVSSFVTFYFNRTFTDNRVILGISDLAWYLLLLNIALLMLGYSFFSQHFLIGNL